MDAASTSNLIAGGALAVSVVAVVRAEVVSRRGARQAAKADAAAEKSAVAADRSAAALEKMSQQWANSLSRAEKRDQRQWSSRPSTQHIEVDWRDRGGPWMGLPPGVGPSEPEVHWTVDRVQGRQHTLKNLGRGTAYDVELSSDNAVQFEGPTEARNIQMGEAIEFLAIGSIQTGTPELIVSWRNIPNGERREWRRPLP